jgi:quinoprotein glucose dehydrogenase
MARIPRRVARAAMTGVFLASVTVAPRGQAPAGGEWRAYAADLASTRYSPLDQINGGNFDKLEVAWRFKTANLGPRPEFQYEGTPLMVKGRLYATGGSRRAVFSLDPGTGELLWVYSENEGRARRPRRGSSQDAGCHTGRTARTIASIT